MSRLSFKQQKFIDEYLKCFNASEASRRAGYKSKPNVSGSQLLANPNIRAEVARRLEENTIKADENLYLISEQALGNEPTTTVIRDGKETNTYDTLAARHLIGKHYQQFTDRIEHTGKGGQPIEFIIIDNPDEPME